ncbi:unnamed protein product [Ixodes persulcatus]
MFGFGFKVTGFLETIKEIGTYMTTFHFTCAFHWHKMLFRRIKIATFRKGGILYFYLSIYTFMLDFFS